MRLFLSFQCWSPFFPMAGVEKKQKRQKQTLLSGRKGKKLIVMDLMDS